MKVHMIVQREQGTTDCLWIIDAIDEWTLDEWNGEYPPKMQQQLDNNPKNCRVLIVEIPDDAMQRAFPEAPVVAGSVALSHTTGATG